MALNREQKRNLKKRGEVDGDADVADLVDADGDDAPSSGSGRTAVATRPTARKDEKKEERTSARQFVKEVRAELRKVAWPTRKETLNYSLIVAVTLIFMTLLIFALDWIFSGAVLWLFGIK